MKFSGKVGNVPVNRWLNFDGDPGTDPDLDRNTGKTCLGEGMHYRSASSISYVLLMQQINCTCYITERL